MNRTTTNIAYVPRAPALALDLFLALERVAKKLALLLG
jgi:hypothetical protein